MYYVDLMETRKRPIDSLRTHNNHTFQIGWVSSSDYCIYITDVRVFDLPERDVTFQSVAGRSGDLALENKRWNNIEVVYSCAIPTDFSTNFSAFKNAIHSLTGYQRIEDTIESDVFKMGVVRGSIEPTVIRKGKAGTFDVRLFCKPQKFLKYGEYSETLTEATSVYNDMGATAKPLITVYGTGPGNLYVGNCTVQIKALADQITLDCDLMNAYRQTGDAAAENKNGDIYAPTFPEFGLGETPISWDGEITHIDYTPRWWRF